MGPFFIIDCEGRIVGNPQGYRTMRGAMRQHDQKGSPAWRAIWGAYELRKAENPDWVKVSAVAAGDRLAEYQAEFSREGQP